MFKRMYITNLKIISIILGLMGIGFLAIGNFAPVSHHQWIRVVEDERGNLVVWTQPWSYPDDDVIVGVAVYEPVTHAWPIPGILEFWSHESFLESPDLVSIQREGLTNEQQEKLKISVWNLMVSYAKTDPNKSSFNPGPDGVTRIRFDLLLQSMYRCGAILIGSLIVGGAFSFIVTLPEYLSRSRSRAIKPWLCRDCGYDCRQLTCDRCPECGTLLHPISSTPA